MWAPIVVASSKSPTGPFENPVETKLGFDPGILVDDDNRVYAYWGGCAAPCYIAELMDDMVTIREENSCEQSARALYMSMGSGGRWSYLV